jgi:hypothetical protein
MELSGFQMLDLCPTFAETGSCLFQKRIFDVSFSLLVLVLLWPVMFAIALAIKLEGEGPGIFFAQDRVQMNGHVSGSWQAASTVTQHCATTFSRQRHSVSPTLGFHHQGVTAGSTRRTTWHALLQSPEEAQLPHVSIFEIPQIAELSRG